MVCFSFDSLGFAVAGGRCLERCVPRAETSALG